MNNGIIDKIVFADLDHVLTNTDIDNTSFWSYDPSKYMLSKHNLASFNKVLDATGSKVVVASNWRRFKWPDIYWEFKGKAYKSLLESFKEMYKGTIIGTLPATKCEALELWFEDNPWFSKYGNYAILEDDLNEGYQDHPVFSKHLVLTDYHVGLTDNDASKAINIIET